MILILGDPVSKSGVEIKMIMICLLTGLFSYLIHGFLNNFLDKDYASVIFWGFVCIITSLSITTKEQQLNELTQNTLLN